MDAYIKKIFDMLYSPIISPYNLLENAKLDNYNYVKYYSNQIGMVAEMECEIPGEGNKVFYYQFDKNDYLQKIFQNVNGIKETVFDRDVAVEVAKTDYYNKSKIVEEVS